MFTPGAQVICIESHSQGLVIIGDTKTVAGISNATCCNLLLLDVGLTVKTKHVKCDCGAINLSLDNKQWVAARLFMPVAGNHKTESITESKTVICPQS